MAEAEIAHVEFKKSLKSGVNPIAEKKRVKLEEKQAALEASRTFEKVAREYWEVNTVNLSEKYRLQKMQRLEKHVFPYIGKKPITEIDFSELVEIVRRIEDLKCSDMPHRIARLIGEVCLYAKHMRYTTSNISDELTKVLKPAPAQKHMAAMTNPADIGKLLADIDTYTLKGSHWMACALWLMPYAFLRSNELCGAKWEEIDIDNAVWIVPSERMKSRYPHVVPLATQVIDKVQKLHKLVSSNFIFPSHSKKGFITGEGLLKALRSLGYSKEVMSIHGFRRIASTLLNDIGNYRPDVIKKQLSHKEKDAVRAAYNDADYFSERRKMMQDWANYLDDLRTQAVNKA